MYLCIKTKEGNRCSTFFITEEYFTYLVCCFKLFNNAMPASVWRIYK